MLNCTIVNDYAGLEDFRAFAKVAPSEALGIAWGVLTSRDDPGRDDGALCVELLACVTEANGAKVVADLILHHWGELSDPIRRNIVSAAGNAQAIPTNLGVRLFHHPQTRTEQRHLILAGFAAGDARDGEGLLMDLASRVGTYSEPYRQAILEQFLQSVRDNFGNGSRSAF